MLPQHSDEYPNCKYLFFIPKRYPFTVSASNISAPRVRYGKNWIVVRTESVVPSITVQKTNEIDMFVLLNAENSSGTFTITY